MDHPRSRGVYVAPEGIHWQYGGSSPLARGLHHSSQTYRFNFQDHPRSRGVYRPGTAAYSPSAGSSPLARGLPVTGGDGFEWGGIIPARAGFTVCDVAGLALSEDHPRSRGVYSGLPGNATSTPGSSPLARGLPGERLGQDVARRIIPARAGFTTSGPPGVTRTPDHPRSRGVYCRRVRVWRTRTGSSPLARGLRNDGHLPSFCCRIIPARAGFTVWQSVWSPSTPDHPRSRGVYR